MREAIVQARDLRWAGEPVRFESSLATQGTADGERTCRYDCRALSAERAFAEMRLSLSPVS